MKFKDLENSVKLLAESLATEHEKIKKYQESIGFDYTWLTPEQEFDISNHIDKNDKIDYEVVTNSKTDNTGTKYKLLINIKFGKYGWYSDTGKFYKSLDFVDRYSHKVRLSELQ